MSEIMKDGREIAALTVDPEHWYYRVGVQGCTKIIPYEERGEMAPVIWFKVLVDGVIVDRINSKFVQAVGYSSKEEASQED